MRKLLLLLAMPLLGSCAALGAGSAAGIMVRAGAGAAAEGALISRVLVSDSLATAGVRGLSGAVRGSMLQSSLAQLTANGTRSAALSITRGGVIRSGAYEVAAIVPESGNVMVGRRVIGQLSNSIIYENNVAVARMKGFIPASSLRVGTVAEQAGYRVLDRPLAVSIEAMQGDGLYLVRVGSAEPMSLDASMLMLAMLPIAAGDGCNDDGGLAVLKSGETMRFDTCGSDGEVTTLVSEGRQTLVFSDEIDGFLDALTAKGLGANRVSFAAGDGVYGRRTVDRGVVEIVNDDGEVVMVADSGRI